MPANTKYYVMLILLALAAGYVVYKPSTSSVAAEIVVDEDGTVHYGGESAKGDWSESIEAIEGIVRINERQAYPGFPMLTNDLVLTTGPYADPEKVEWTVRAGRRYEAVGEVGGAGTYRFVTIIPTNIEAAVALESVEDGDDVTLKGRVSNDGRMTAPDGSWVSVPVEQWTLMLLETIEVYASPE